ncbi:pyridoxamine 5'-phosphate oxidase family protein [Flagellimonas lutimaris]|uniref:pyridoxamine 5'-phosphate oxidase family protein n=1 Tax=Flagellimonas lutimaris TaxID=475082 RepID=UPI003F5CDB74
MKKQKDIFTSDIAFTPTIKALQEQYGSRKAYAQMESKRGWQEELSPPIIDFVEKRDSFYMGTSNQQGQPYIQHRGGAPGFLKVMDPKTLAFADFSGNQQYISVGNLSENPRSFIFLMDYPSRTRVKIWGEAHVEFKDKALMESLAVNGYSANVERAIIFKIKAVDVNCPQHIVQRYTSDEIDQMVIPLKERIKELENELNKLK